MKIINLKNMMKKFIALVLGVAVFFTAIPAFTLQAEDTISPGLSVSTTTVTAGNSVSVYVNAQNWEKLAGLNFAIHYDSSALQVSNTYNGSLVSSAVVDVNKSAAGVVQASLISLDGISGSGQVLRIVFSSLSVATPGDYDLELVVSEAYNTGFEDITISKTSGKITVNERTATETQVSFLAVPSKTALETSEEFTYQIKSTYSIGNLAGGDYEIRYDAEYLEVVDVTLGMPFTTSTAVTSINSNTAGYIKVSHADIQKISATYGTVLFTVSFKTKDKAVDSTNIDFSTSGLTDVDLNSMTSSTITKAISITEREPEIIYPAFKLLWDGITSEDRTVQVDVVLPGEAMVSAGDFSVTYDKGKMICTKAETDSDLTFAGGLLITKEDIGNGTVTFSYVNSNPTGEDTTILHLTFEIVDGFFGEASIQASGKDVVNSMFEDVTLSYPLFNMELNSISGLTISSLQEEYTYTGIELKPTVVINNFIEGQDFTVEYASNINIGTATVIIKGINSYSGTITKTFKIVPADLSELADEAISGLAESYVYNGEAIIPEVSIGQFVAGVDYDVSYKNNLNVGTATVVVTGKGNCIGIFEKTFTILPTGITGMTIEIVSVEGGFVYTGEEIKPEITVAGYTEGVDYEVSYKNNVNVGTATVVITGKGNYSGTKETTFIILPTDMPEMKVEVVPVDGGFIYNGQEIKPAVVVEGYTEGVDYEVSYKNNVNAGTATVIITGKGNYAGTTEATFTILPANMSDMTVEIVPTESGFVYNGQAIKPTVVVEGYTEGVDYEVSYQNNVNAGIATIMITATGNNCTGTTTETFLIEKAQQKINASDCWYSSIQETSFSLDIISVQGDGKLLYRSENPEIVEVDENGIVVIHNPGTATITVIKEETDNYAALYKTVIIDVASQYNLSLGWDGYVLELAVPGELLISSAIFNVLIDFDKLSPIDANFRGNALNKIDIQSVDSDNGFSFLYTNIAPEISDTFVMRIYLAKLLDIDTTTIQVQTNDVVGKYEQLQLEYDPVTVLLNDITGCDYWVDELEESYIYTGKEIRPDFKFGSFSIENYIAAGLLSVEYINNLNVGTATIKVTGQGELIGCFEKTFQILAVDIHSMITQDSISGLTEKYVYMGAEVTPKIEVKGLSEGVDYELSYANNDHVGTATVIITGIGNYTGTIEKTFTIIARGDMNQDGLITTDDAIYLLYHTTSPEEYPIYQNGDLDKNGTVNSNDAIYLLYYTFMPDKYPLY